jgi:hypothetical protein
VAGVIATEFKIDRICPLFNPRRPRVRELVNSVRSRRGGPFNTAGKNRASGRIFRRLRGFKQLMGEDVQKMEALLVSPKGAAWRRAQFLCSISAKVPDNFADKQLLRILLAKKIRG